MQAAEPRITASMTSRTCRTSKTCGSGTNKRPFADLRPPHPCAGSSHACPNRLTRPTGPTAVVFLLVAQHTRQRAANDGVPLPKRAVKWSADNSIRVAEPIAKTRSLIRQKSRVRVEGFAATRCASGGWHHHTRPPSIGDANGVAVKHKPGGVNPFPQLIKK